jgi:hypothetical protein
MKLKKLLVVPMLMATSYLGVAGTQSAAQAQDLLPQGTFDQVAANNKPGGWDIKFGPENVSLAGDAKNRWVQLRDGAVLSQVVKFPSVPRPLSFRRVSNSPITKKAPRSGIVRVFPLLSRMPRARK